MAWQTFSRLKSSSLQYTSASFTFPSYPSSFFLRMGTNLFTHFLTFFYISIIDYTLKGLGEMVFNRNTMQITELILYFLEDTLKRQKHIKTGKTKFNKIFYQNISKIRSFSYAINTKLLIRRYTFPLNLQNLMCFLLLHTSPLGLSTFQVLSGHLRIMAAILVSLNFKNLLYGLYLL